MKRITCIIMILSMLFAGFPAVFAADADITDFEPFALTVQRIGQSGNGQSLRFIVTTNGFPFEVEENSLTGTSIRGSVSSKSSGEAVAEIDEKITGNEMRDDGGITLVFPMVSGIDVSSQSDYTYDLSLYPAEPKDPEESEEPKGSEEPGETEEPNKSEEPKETEEPKWDFTVHDFEPFALTVSTLGSNKNRIRLVVSPDQFPFDATVTNILRGCTITGTMTRLEESDSYPLEVTFTDVPVEVSELRSDGRINIELTITDEVNMSTIDTTSTGGFKMYKFDLTIYPSEEEELVLPENEITFFVKPLDFADDMGTWTIDTDGSLTGLKNSTDEKAEYASVIINVPESGVYYIWGLASDSTASYQGRRTFKIGINGENLPNLLGNHGYDGYRWQFAGSCELKQGENIVKVVDTSKYYARLSGIMFTTSPEFEGVSAGVLDKAFEEYGAEIIERIQIDIEPSMGNKVVYKIKNRTDEPIGEGARLYAAIYNENDALVEVKIIEDIAVGARERTEWQTVEFSGLDEWKNGKLMLMYDDMKPLAPAEAFTFTQTDLANPDPGSDDNYGTVTDWMLDYVNEKEFNARSGLSNVLTKLENGDQVTVGYVGTSITHGNTWRPSTTKWLKETYPQADITEVSIAASGTNSDLGASLIRPMLLEPHHPDLVFVEYVIDGGKGEWMEGIVRQIWQFDPSIDIYMVHPVHTTNYNIYENGGVNALTAEYEKVAEYYNIPSVNLNYQIFDLYDQGLLTLKASEPEEGKILFSKDGTHPTADGGYLYAGAVARGIIKMNAAKEPDTVYHTIPDTPLYENNWSDAYSISDFSKVKFEGDWFDCAVDKASSGYGTNFNYTGGYLALIKDMFPTMKGTSSPGSSVTIKFKGTTVGLFEVGGQYSGCYSVQIDDNEPYTFNSINSYCTKLRHQYFFIPEQEYGEHTVKITLTDEIPAIKTQLHDQNPRDDVYNRLEAYFGHILVRGEVIDISGE